MPVESVFPRLEPLLPQVQKPIQYVGGELNSTVKDWDAGDGPLGADVPGRLRGRACPTRACRSSTRCSTSVPDALAERTYAVWPDLEALMREHGVPQFTVDAHRPVGAFDVLGVSLLHRARLHQPAHRARPGGHPAATPPTAATTHPIVLAGGHAAFNPEPIADFIDAAVLGDGEQVVLAITEVIREWKAEGSPGGRDELLLRLAESGGVYVPRVLRRRLPARRPDPARRAEPAGRAVAGAQAHRHGPRRVAVPEAAAGAAGRDRARADERGDLPRLHPRLPVLPGRHDHPAGARAVDHHGIGEMVENGLDGRPASRRSACCRCPAPTTPRSATIAKGLADRYEGTNTGAVAALDPGRRVQHRPGQRALPQRPPLRPHLRARGRQRADAQGDQQDGHRGRPDPHRRHRLRQRLAAGEAVLHVRPAHRDRRGRAAIADLAKKVIKAGREVTGSRDIRCTVSHRRVRAQAAHPVPVGRPGRPRDGRPPAAQAAGRAPRRQGVRQGDRLPLPRRQARRSSRACCPAATAGSAR